MDRSTVRKKDSCTQNQNNSVAPETIHVVLYRGVDNEWYCSLPSEYLTNAQMHASHFKDSKILKYELTEVTEVSETNRKKWDPLKRTRRVRKPTSIPRRVRRVRTVRTD